MNQRARARGPLELQPFIRSGQLPVSRTFLPQALEHRQNRRTNWIAVQHAVPHPTPDTARHAGTHLRPYVKDEVQQVETIHAPHLILVQFKQIVDDTAVSAQIRR